MLITPLALRHRFEAEYLADLGTKDKYILEHPEETKKSFFRRRIGGDYEMIMVEGGWTCFKLGWKAAGGEIHGESEESRTSTPTKQADE